MQEISSYKIYNASAGSGKTFTLTADYLAKILTAKSHQSFRRILAMTFTNKAVTEMKTRILDSLVEFTQIEEDESVSDLCHAVMTISGLDEKTIQKKSVVMLKQILDNYAAFEVSTIDAFTHKIIRTFAKDLNLSFNFDIEMDAKALLENAVNRVIDKVGNDQQLTQILIDFTTEKIYDDKSGYIFQDIFDAALLLLNDNEIEFVEALQSYQLSDFAKTKRQLNQEVKNLKAELKELSEQMLAVFESQGVTDDFNKNTIPNFFKRIADEEKLPKIKFDAKWQSTSDTSVFYTKKTSDESKQVIDDLAPQVFEAVALVEKKINQIDINKKVSKNMTQLSVLNLVQREMKLIKEERNVQLISDFNKTINTELKDQPTPFIYERLGEKFQHFFIDEFQDTSQMQWTNLKPLVENALSSLYDNQESGSLTLVGDPKQSIYRWRGGDVGQFVNLIAGDTDFNRSPKVVNLPNNYRSAREVVRFNNGLFASAKEQVDSPLVHSIYEEEKLKQQPIKKANGYVNVRFVEAKNKAEKNEQYAELVIAKIQTKRAQGFLLKDMCILVRKKEQGIVLANALTKEGVTIISSESLLISSDASVQFLNSLLTFLENEEDVEAKYKLISYLDEHLVKPQNSFTFVHRLMRLSTEEFWRELKNFDIDFQAKKFHELPLYDSVEYAIDAFHIADFANAYVQFYLDEIFDFTQKKVNNLKSFLSHWETKASTKGIVAPENQDAVEIMTIHKSKGLEFPIVLYPYADETFAHVLQSHVWLPLDETKALSLGLVRKPSSKNTNPAFQKELQSLVSETELENLNLLYVSLTRASQELHVFSAQTKDNQKNYYNTFKDYALEKNKSYEDLEIEFGQSDRDDFQRKTTDNNQLFPIKFLASQEKFHVKLVTEPESTVESDQVNARRKGNLIHDLLAHIDTISDIDLQLDKVLSQGEISIAERVTLKSQLIAIINHDQLKVCFSEKWQSYNERDIFYKGKLLRPDKFCTQGQKAIIIDYKTGGFSQNHAIQIQNYAEAIKALGFEVEQKMIVYISESIEIKIL
ncbi:MAG: UvrD-helicase domain-containing protein [Flavobacteriaceae bacterium]